jgi:hypothetical protein
LPATPPKTAGPARLLAEPGRQPRSWVASLGYQAAASRGAAALVLGAVRLGVAMSLPAAAARVPVPGVVAVVAAVVVAAGAVVVEPPAPVAGVCSVAARVVALPAPAPVAAPDPEIGRAHV